MMEGASNGGLRGGSGETSINVTRKERADAGGAPGGHCAYAREGRVYVMDGRAHGRDALPVQIVALPLPKARVAAFIAVFREPTAGEMRANGPMRFAVMTANAVPQRFFLSAESPAAAEVMETPPQKTSFE